MIIETLIVIPKFKFNKILNKCTNGERFCNSSYILKVPFGNEDSSGLIYVWIGSKADAEDIKLIQEIADTMFNNV